MSSRQIASGPFKPTWESLKQSQNQTPDWFRNAKFGIWAHWSAQCVPEQGDWYGRHMYIQGHPQYEHHCKTYGHPTKFGFMEIENLWKAEHWNPDELMDLYVKAGAKYFVALANHHDNFDCYDSISITRGTRFSTGRRRTSSASGRRRRAQRGFASAFPITAHTRGTGIRLRTATIPKATNAGVRYDAYRLTKADGKGKWWEGLDPQDLYTGPHMVMPDGIKSIKERARLARCERRPMARRRAGQQRAAGELVPAARDLLDRYKPDLFYLDNTELPMGQAGLDIAAHYYNSSIRDHGTASVRAHREEAASARGWCLYARHRARRIARLAIAPLANLHVHRRLALQTRYRIRIGAMGDPHARRHRCENGNLLLSIPMRGDGTIDDRERKILSEIADWMRVNGEAIYDTAVQSFRRRQRARRRQKRQQAALRGRSHPLHDQRRHGLRDRVQLAARWQADDQVAGRHRRQTR